VDSGNVAIVRAVFEAFGQGDVEAVLELADREITFEPVSTPVREREPYHGHDGMREYMRDLDETWEEFEVTISDVREGPDQVVALGRIKAIATGGAYMTDSPAGVVLRLREGKILWGKVFTNVSDALAAGGLE
jgi:ketosteroid isomerase-like protein